MSNIVLIDYTYTGHHISYSHTLIKGLKEKGHRVHVIGDPNWVESCESMVDGVFPVTLDLSTSTVFSKEKCKVVFLKSCLLIANDLAPDVIHFLYIDHFILSAAMVLSKKEDVSVCVTLHAGYMLPEFSLTLSRKVKSLIEIYLVRKLAEKKIRFMVHSQALQKELSKHISDESVDYVPYPIGSFKGVDRETARKFIVDSTDITRLDSVLLCFGDTRYDKGVDLVVKALPFLEGYHLLIAGKADDFGKKKILEIAKILGVDDRVHLHLHFIAEDKIPFYFKGSDIVVIPYRKSFSGQSGPLTIAATLAVPVVASNVLVLAETVERYNLGVTFDAESPKSLANAVNEIENPYVSSVDSSFSIDHDASMFVAKVLKSYFRCYK